MLIKKIHFNKPQIRSVLVGAPNELLIAGRALGKTKIVLANKSAQCYFHSMPRSTGVILNKTFTQAFGRTLGELEAGWQMLGYVKGHHFLSQEKPTDKWIKKWKWKGPFTPVLDYKNTICWWNGAVAKLISQERPGSSNGLSIDWIIGDEIKFIDEEKYKTELDPANRGIIPEYDGNPYHHGFTFTTDMPVGSAGRWLFDLKDEMDEAVVKQIMQLQTVRYILIHEQLPGAKKPVANEIEKQIAIIDDEINILRKGLIYYHEASTLDNIHALGSDYVKRILRTSSQFLFDTQILNIRPLKLEAGFYPDFDEEKHGYYAEYDGYFDSRIIDPSNPGLDCRKDSDLNWDLALDIALDYNKRIHPLVVGQDDGDGLRTKNAMHALYPGKLAEVTQMFIEYYKPYKRKLVRYWYDHTAVGDDNKTRKCDEVVSLLEKAGWSVIRMYTGKAPAHEAKYRMWGHIHNNDGHYKKSYGVNRENCRYLILSKYQAMSEPKKDGFGKDKKSEHDPKFPAEESTHYSDAEDQLYYGWLESGLSYSNEAKTSEGIITRR